MFCFVFVFFSGKPIRIFHHCFSGVFIFHHCFSGVLIFDCIFSCHQLSLAWAAKFSTINILNSGVVIYLLLSGILFSTAVRAVLGIYVSNIRYFVFNLICFSIKKSIGSSVSNTWYFVFSLIYFKIKNSSSS